MSPNYSVEQQGIRRELIEQLAKLFAKASGYALTNDNVDQWMVVSATLVDGMVTLLTAPPGKGTDITMRHTDINA
jgi:hypothetical protein